MALQFQPPPDWLIEQYMNRPNPVVQGLQGANQLFQQYAQRKLQEKQLAFQDQQRKVTEFGAVAPYVPEDQIPGLAKNYGVNIPVAGAQPPVSSTGTAPSPTAGLPDEQGQPVTEAPQISPLVQAHIQSTGRNPLNLPIPTSKAGLAKYKTGLETQKLQQELDKPSKGPLSTITKEQALANGTFDPSKQMMVEPPAPRLDLSEKQSQFDQKEWDKIVKEVNPLTAGTRTTLGMAAKADFQANRALVTLSKPVVTNQEAGNVMADIAAIYQNGSPTQYGMSHQEYSTLYGRLQGALQSVTGKPQDALPDAIKERLVGVLHEMKGTNNSVLKQQLDFTEKAKSRVIKKFPDEWKDIRSTFENNSPETNNPGSAKIPGTGPYGASVSQNGNIYNWNPRTVQYE